MKFGIDTSLGLEFATAGLSADSEHEHKTLRLLSLSSARPTGVIPRPYLAFMSPVIVKFCIFRILEFNGRGVFLSAMSPVLAAVRLGPSALLRRRRLRRVHRRIDSSLSHDCQNKKNDIS